VHQENQVKADSWILLDECPDELAKNGVMNEKPPQGSQQHVCEAGEDTDAEEYVLRDWEETLTDDWHEERRPECTLIWKNGIEFLIFPPVPAPTSFVAFDQMGAHARVWSKPAELSDDTDSGPDSDTAWLIPERVVAPGLSSVSVLIDPTKVFGYGCPPIDLRQYQEHPYARRPQCVVGCVGYVFGYSKCGIWTVPCPNSSNFVQGNGMA
jgi:hypothetical protein